MPIDWTGFVDTVNKHQRFLVTSHVRPDCDALGSELGLAGVLETVGKEVWIVNGDSTPPSLAFIDPARRIRVLNQDIQRADLESVEVFIVLDTSAWAQLGPMADALRSTSAKKLIIDHHVSQDDLGAELFKDPSAEATGRLVVQAAEQLGVALTAEIAIPLFAAVATDTGWFRFSSTSAETYRLAAQLVAAGAEPPAIYRDLYEQDTLGRVRLRGVILSRLSSEMDGRLVHTYVRKVDFEKTGSIPSDTEDAINMALAVGGSQVAVILVEQGQGGFKISFRSRCELDCNRVAASFGGGGHKAAAGAFINEPFDSARATVLDAVRAAMR